MLHMIGSTVNRNGPTEATSTPKAEGLRMPEGTVSPDAAALRHHRADGRPDGPATHRVRQHWFDHRRRRTVTLRVSSSQPGGAANNATPPCSTSSRSWQKPRPRGVKLQYFSDSRLGEEAQIAKQMSLGTVDMAIISPSASGFADLVGFVDYCFFEPA